MPSPRATNVETIFNLNVCSKSFVIFDVYLDDPVVIIVTSSTFEVTVAL